MKKVIVGIIIAILIIAAGFGAYYVLNSKKGEDVSSIDQNTLSSNDETNEVKEESITDLESEDLSNDGKILVVYYSAQSHTKAVAEKIAEELNADLFEIVPEDVYTSDDLDWTDSNSRVYKEHNDESLQDVKLVEDTVDNWDEYDTVLIGYPIWWGNAAWPTNTFVKANNFTGKNVIPFCTSSSSGLGQSGKLLAEEANGGNWLDGQRFKSNPSDSDIKDFVDSIK